MNPETQRKMLKVVKVGLLLLQAVIVVLLIRFALQDFSSATPMPENIAFQKWYGNWPVVLTTSILVLLFLFFLTRPRRPKEWKGAGLSAAFFISLFTEMYGIPLTIYLLAPLLGVEPEIFGAYESHLWAYLLARAGIIPLTAGVHLIMVVSTILLILGFTLVALGWRRVYRGRGELVTTGLYARLRHPQYLGLMLMVIGFLIMWPTLLTIILAPFLIVRYLLLAKEEDRYLEEKFGDVFRRYKSNVAAFLPALFSRGDTFGFSSPPGDSRV